MFTNFFKLHLAPLVLRLILGLIFVIHGFDKVMAKGGTAWMEEGAKKFQEDADTQRQRLIDELRGKGAAIPESAAAAEKPKPQDPMPALIQLLVAWGEFIGGIALFVGFLPRLAAGGIIVIMVGAIVIATGRMGFKAPMGYEYNLVIISMCLAVIFLGGGRFSLEGILWGRKPS